MRHTHKYTHIHIYKYIHMNTYIVVDIEVGTTKKTGGLSIG